MTERGGNTDNTNEETVKEERNMRHGVEWNDKEKKEEKKVIR